MTQRVGVIRFPGTNCEFDTIDAVRALGGEAEILWHSDSSIKNVDAIVIPGGFAHGDYLRCGAIARFSPVMEAVSDFALAGGPVLGICNGFQVLTEAGLLPGALQKNAGMKFLCSMQQIEFVSTQNVVGKGSQVGDCLQIPINHFEGNYVCSPEILSRLETQEQIVFRYTDNPNGSIKDIAGICNEAGNVVGMMPHPERATSDLLGSNDGAALIQSFLSV
ncbi:MAG: phosphoribosylformylglycinamidine synthase I [Acidimicrobiaceae bacterium]|nr:phosphoribosylformylglycinamidine synthase I [Acidimicrobiaceae bacterium]|tara:strand:- start:7032 stop:7691 length:660 start_codon:yes stop_codon:yes gene_type:complete